MAIYGRFGNKLEILRLATLDDVKRLERRKPDKQDREAVKNDSYVLVRSDDGRGGTREEVYHQAFIRADGGLREISDALAATGATQFDTAARR